MKKKRFISKLIDYVLYLTGWIIFLVLSTMVIFYIWFNVIDKVSFKQLNDNIFQIKTVAYDKSENNYRLIMNIKESIERNNRINQYQAEDSNKIRKEIRDIKIQINGLFNAVSNINRRIFELPWWCRSRR